MARPGSASSWATATAPFRPTEKQALQDVLNAPGPAAVADLNGDGIPDIALMETGTLGIFLGKGDGMFATPFIWERGPIPAEFWRRICTGSPLRRGGRTWWRRTFRAGSWC